MNKHNKKQFYELLNKILYEYEYFARKHGRQQAENVFNNVYFELCEKYKDEPEYIKAVEDSFKLIYLLKDK
jgi:hypothetical protein